MGVIEGVLSVTPASDVGTSGEEGSDGVRKQWIASVPGVKRSTTEVEDGMVAAKDHRQGAG